MSGVWSIAFRAILFVCPGAGALTRIEIIATSSVAFGLLTTMFALALRSLDSEDSRDAGAVIGATTSAPYRIAVHMIVG